MFSSEKNWKRKRERSFRTSPFSRQSMKNYFFFLTAFLTAFLAGAFFLAVAIENHPLFMSHILRESLLIKNYHWVRNKFFRCRRQM